MTFTYLFISSLPLRAKGLGGLLCRGWLVWAHLPNSLCLGFLLFFSIVHLNRYSTSQQTETEKAVCLLCCCAEKVLAGRCSWV